MTALASIRLRRGEELRFLWMAFAASLAAHGAAYLLWALLSFAALSLQARMLKDLQAASLTAQQKAQSEPPLLFIEVRPEQATLEPPKDAKYYSAANSQAANPDPRIDTGVPQIEGTQDKIVKTFDTLRPAPEPLDPAPPAPETPEPPAEPKPPDGDLHLVKPAEPKPRPRSLIEARLRQEGAIAGEKMRQEGGVKRRGIVSLDARATPFGAYDAAVIQAIQKRWYDLLEDSGTPSRQGKVLIEFRMHSDGHLTDLKVVEQDVGEILSLYCRKAIADPAPFAPWPSEMRTMIGRDYRDIRITFFYQ